MDTVDPGWWRTDATPAVDLPALNMADPHTCLLGQRFSIPSGNNHQAPRSAYKRGLAALGIAAGDAYRYGVAGVDVDLITPGVRRLIASRRAAADHPTEPPVKRGPACLPS